MVLTRIGNTKYWDNVDGLHINFGPDKATSELAGDFSQMGNARMAEVFLDVSTLTTTSQIVSDTVLVFPAGATGGANSNTWMIDKVELMVETAVATITSLSVGLVQKSDRTTVPSNYDHALINAEVVAAMATAGDQLVYVGTDSVPAGSTHGGTLIGTTPAAATGPYFITAKIAGSTGTGKVRIRVFYHGTGTITQ
jgi:hypothetical protein